MLIQSTCTDARIQLNIQVGSMRHRLDTAAHTAYPELRLGAYKTAWRDCGPNMVTVMRQVLCSSSQLLPWRPWRRVASLVLKHHGLDIATIEEIAAIQGHLGAILVEAAVLHTPMVELVANDAPDALHE